MKVNGDMDGVGLVPIRISEPSMAGLCVVRLLSLSEDSYKYYCPPATSFGPQAQLIRPRTILKLQILIQTILLITFCTSQIGSGKVP
jgi:hypothetical protein